MQKYFPAIVMFLLGLLFLRFPALAVALVSGSLFAFSLAYVMIVRRLARQVGDRSVIEINGGPSFQNVSSYIFRMSGPAHRYRASGPYPDKLNDDG
jgi:hypothetical protein